MKYFTVRGLLHRLPYPCPQSSHLLRKNQTYENCAVLSCYDGKYTNYGCNTYSTGTKRAKMCKQFMIKPPPKYKPVTHVLFDLDGTLLSTENLHYASAKTYLNRVFKKNIGIDLYGRVMGSTPKDGASLLIKELNLPITPEIYLHGVWQDLRNTLPHCGEMPGVDYLVCHFERCKVPIGVASSTTRDLFNMKTKIHKKLFSKFCPIVLAGSDPAVARGKPHPDTYIVAANRFPNPPDNIDKVLAIEDSLNGVIAAKAAGMQVVMIPHRCLPTKYIEAAKPDLVLKTLQDFDPKPFNLPTYRK